MREAGSVPAFPDLEWSLAFSPAVVMSRDELMDGYYPCFDLALYMQHYVNPVFAYGGAIDLWFNPRGPRADHAPGPRIPHPQGGAEGGWGGT